MSEKPKLEVLRMIVDKDSKEVRRMVTKRSDSTAAH